MVNLSTAQPMHALVDEELAHIEAIIQHSLSEIEINPFLTSPYWRRRVADLLDCIERSPSQLRRADALIVALDRFDEQCAFSEKA
jgi:hypothetical protein